MNLLKRFLPCVLVVMLALSASMSIASSLVVKDIRIVGLRQVSQATVLRHIAKGIKIGQPFDTTQTTVWINALYRTGFFEQVELVREGSTLIIRVVERARIAEIHFQGNQQISTEKLRQQLKTFKIRVGHFLMPSHLMTWKQQVLDQYHQKGYRDVRVDTHVERHGTSGQAALNILIHEGKLAKIGEIVIQGAHAFSQPTLIKQFVLSKTHFWSFLTRTNRYSQQALDQSLDRLQSFYLNHGYIHYHVMRTSVQAIHGSRSLRLLVVVEEGSPYTVETVHWSFDASLSPKDQKALQALMPKMQSKQHFSRDILMQARVAMSRYLANKGYAFAKIEMLPRVHETDKHIDVSIRIHPGQRVYVRWVHFIGNHITEDHVLRRESLQMEGSLFSLRKIELSQRRLNNLGYFEHVGVAPSPVPGSPGQVDLTYTVVEKKSSIAAANFQMGYNDVYGLQYSVDLTQNNFLGRGHQVSIAFDRNQYETYYGFQDNNPYVTLGGISRHFSIYNRRQTPGKTHITPFNMNVYGGMVEYGIPATENSRIHVGLGYEHMTLNFNVQRASYEVQDFARRYGHQFRQFKLVGGWSYSTYDRSFLPTQGMGHSLSFEFGLPFGSHSLDYYKLNYMFNWYEPVYLHTWIVHLWTHLGYGHGYGERGSDLPFFKNFYAGGINSLPGFLGNSLGPRDSNNSPLGGNILGLAHVGLIFPNPAGPRVRSMLVLGVGNVYKNRVDWRQLRSSLALLVEWQSPMGPLEFSLAVPWHKKPGDQINRFDFTIGLGF